MKTPLPLSKNAAQFIWRIHVIDETRQRKCSGIDKEMKKESYKCAMMKSVRSLLGQALSADTILRSTVTELGGLFILGVELMISAKL